MLKIIIALLISIASTIVTAETQYEVYKEEIDLTQKIIARQRNDVVLKNMNLPSAEEKAFFEIYNDYRDEMQPVLDSNLKLLTDYAETYVNNNLTDEQALKFTKTFLDMKGIKIAIRKKYVNKLSKKISAKHIARFIQLESKLDAIMDFDVARKVPLVKLQ